MFDRASGRSSVGAQRLYRGLARPVVTHATQINSASQKGGRADNRSTWHISNPSVAPAGPGPISLAEMSTSQIKLTFCVAKTAGRRSVRIEQVDSI
jgi:hypothetical protein